MRAFHMTELPREAQERLQIAQYWRGFLDRQDWPMIGGTAVRTPGDIAALRTAQDEYVATKWCPFEDAEVGGKLKPVTPLPFHNDLASYVKTAGAALFLRSLAGVVRGQIDIETAFDWDPHLESLRQCFAEAKGVYPDVNSNLRNMFDLPYGYNFELDEVVALGTMQGVVDALALHPMLDDLESYASAPIDREHAHLLISRLDPETLDDLVRKLDQKLFSLEDTLRDDIAAEHQSDADRYAEIAIADRRMRQIWSDLGAGVDYEQVVDKVFELAEGDRVTALEREFDKLNVAALRGID